MSKVPITNPVLTAVIGLIGLLIVLLIGQELLFPGLEISGLSKSMDRPLAVSCLGLIAGLATFTGCCAIYFRKRWGYRCAAVGLFIFVPGMIYRLTTTESSLLGWLWVVGFFGMAMHFWQTGRPPRLRRRVITGPPVAPPGE